MNVNAREVKVEGYPALGPYSQGVIVGYTVYVSGQLPMDPSTGVLVEGDTDAKVSRVFENIKLVLEAAGCSLSNIVRLEIFCTDLKDFAVINDVCKRYLHQTDPLPARQTVQVAALPKGASIEISCIAAKAQRVMRRSKL